MEHESLLRLEAVERANSARTAEEEAREAKASAEMLAESLRIQVCLHPGFCSLTTIKTVIGYLIERGLYFDDIDVGKNIS